MQEKLWTLLGAAFAGMVWWCGHLSGELDEQKANVAVMEQDARVLKESLRGLADWTAVTDKALEEHRLAAKRQEAEFRKLQAQVREAYADKDTSEWGRTSIPEPLRILLGGKPGTAGD